MLRSDACTSLQARTAALSRAGPPEGGVVVDVGVPEAYQRAAAGADERAGEDGLKRRVQHLLNPLCKSKGVAPRVCAVGMCFGTGRAPCWLRAPTGACDASRQPTRPPVRTYQEGRAGAHAALEHAQQVGVARLGDLQAVAGLHGAHPRIGLALSVSEHVQRGGERRVTQVTRAAARMKAYRHFARSQAASACLCLRHLCLHAAVPGKERRQPCAPEGRSPAASACSASPARRCLC